MLIPKIFFQYIHYIYRHISNALPKSKRQNDIQARLPQFPFILCSLCKGSNNTTGCSILHCTPTGYLKQVDTFLHLHDFCHHNYFEQRKTQLHDTRYKRHDDRVRWNCPEFVSLSSATSKRQSANFMYGTDSNVNLTLYAPCIILQRVYK